MIMYLKQTTTLNHTNVVTIWIQWKGMIIGWKQIRSNYLLSKLSPFQNLGHL